MATDPDLHRVAVDIAILHDGDVLLIKREYEPFRDAWCLPGGHVDSGEQVHEAAIREAKEETRMDVELDKLVGVYDAPGRDPRGPVISLVYTAHPIADTPEPEAATDARRVKWFPLDDLPGPLGFDHATILADVRSLH